MKVLLLSVLCGLFSLIAIIVFVVIAHHFFVESLLFLCFIVLSLVSYPLISQWTKK